MAGDTVQLGLDRAERCWRAALHYHQLIEHGERSGYGYLDWPEVKAMLVKIAEGFEHEAREVERVLD